MYNIFPASFEKIKRITYIYQYLVLYFVCKIMATHHAEAILNNVVEDYERSFTDNNAYESLLFFFMLATPSNPESRSMVTLHSAIDGFRKKYFHQYLHYEQDRLGDSFVKAFQTFDEIKDPKKKHYVEFIQNVRNMWDKPLPGGHANGEYIIFSRPDDPVSKWCTDEVRSLCDPKSCHFCTSKKQLVRTFIVPFADGGTSCPANILSSCRTCREAHKTMSADEQDARLRLMLRTDPSVQPTVKKLAGLPVSFLQGYYRNPSYDNQASFKNGIQDAMGSVTPLLKKCQEELEVARQICAELDTKYRKRERKMQALERELNSAKHFNLTLRRTIEERENELRFVYRQVHRSNQHGWSNYERNQAISHNQSGHSRGYGSVYGRPRENVWNTG